MSTNFHVKRTRTANKEVLSQWNGARSTRWVTPPDGKSVLEIQTTHTPQIFKDVPDDKNVLIPPYHWHWYQDEYFHVREGRYIFTLEGTDTTVSATDPQPVHISARARHTFRADPSHAGPCTIEISTDVSPAASSSTARDAAGASERFFRNIYSYLEDCHSQGVAPSLPQLLLMLDAAEVSLGFAWGPDWLMRVVTWGMGVVVGRWIGGGLLGYRASYEEYYDEGFKWRGDQAGQSRADGLDGEALGSGLTVQNGEARRRK